jgi:ribosomal protein L16 Arg81 hydroxylase
MCAGGGAKKQQQQQAEAAAAAQEQSLKLQQEQMAIQQQQFQAQQAQYQEQLTISKAPPPPAPNEVAQAAQSAIESTDMATGQTIKLGIGRRKLRTDLTPVSTLGIPGVA